MYNTFLKPLIDKVLALIAFILLSPILLIVACAVKLDSDGPVFFLQERLGKDGKVFKIFKFRSMVNSRDNLVLGQPLLESDPKITKVGRFIRKTSLDEIPQLINILKGDMSFIGPRPLLVKYLSLYNNEQAKRHSIRPGITGWAQVNGRNAISWKEKFELDVYYVNNLSILIDLKIFFMTIKKVVFSENINEGENITMSSFKGNQ